MARLKNLCKAYLSAFIGGGAFCLAGIWWPATATGVTELSIAELEDVYAAARCCDNSGSWSECPGVSGDSQCATAPPPPSMPPLLYTSGSACAAPGAACSWAPEGPYDAQCELTFCGTCSTTTGNACSQFRNGTCSTNWTDLDTNGDGITDNRYYECNCAGGTPAVPAVWNNTRTACTGTACWF